VGKHQGANGNSKKQQRHMGGLRQIRIENFLHIIQEGGV
jgi:hypothetical protein